VRYPSSDSVNSLSVYFSCNSLQQSELCFYYYCVSVGFALCDIPFFSFFSRVSKRKKANKNKNCQFCDSFQATSESVFREEAKKKSWNDF
jgi:hypothetical protein